MISIHECRGRFIICFITQSRDSSLLWLHHPCPSSVPDSIQVLSHMERERGLWGSRKKLGQRWRNQVKKYKPASICTHTYTVCAERRLCAGDTQKAGAAHSLMWLVIMNPCQHKHMMSIRSRHVRLETSTPRSSSQIVVSSHSTETPF